MTDTGENTRNYYRNQGAEAERERIIKLLQEHQDVAGWIEMELHDEEDGLIALIKGEK